MLPDMSPRVPFLGALWGPAPLMLRFHGAKESAAALPPFQHQQRFSDAFP